MLVRVLDSQLERICLKNLVLKAFRSLRQEVRECVEDNTEKGRSSIHWRVGESRVFFYNSSTPTTVIGVYSITHQRDKLLLSVCDVKQLRDYCDHYSRLIENDLRTKRG